MEKLTSLLLTGLAFNAFATNALADAISFTNDTATPLYMAVKKSPLDGYTSNSEIGWIHHGKTGVIHAHDDYLTNMGIEPNDRYILGFFNADTHTYHDCAEVISGTDRSFKYENGSCAEINQNAIMAPYVFNSGIMGCAGIEIETYNPFDFALHHSEVIIPEKQRPMLRTMYQYAAIDLHGPISVSTNIKSAGEVNLSGGARVLGNIDSYVTDELTMQGCDLLNLERFLAQYSVSEQSSHLVTDIEIPKDIGTTHVQAFKSTFKEPEITPTNDTVEVYKVNNLDIQGRLSISEGNVHIYVANNLTLGEHGAISIAKNASLTLFVEEDVNWQGQFTSRQYTIDSRPIFSLYAGGESVNIVGNIHDIAGIIYAPNAHLNIDSQSYSLPFTGAMHVNYFTWNRSAAAPGYFSYIEELSQLFNSDK